MMIYQLTDIDFYGEWNEYEETYFSSGDCYQFEDYSDLLKIENNTVGKNETFIIGVK
jgi:hypothetical protein